MLPFSDTFIGPNDLMEDPSCSLVDYRAEGYVKVLTEPNEGAHGQVYVNHPRILKGSNVFPINEIESCESEPWFCSKYFRDAYGVTDFREGYGDTDVFGMESIGGVMRPQEISVDTELQDDQYLFGEEIKGCLVPWDPFYLMTMYQDEDDEYYIAEQSPPPNTSDHTQCWYGGPHIWGREDTLNDHGTNSDYCLWHDCTGLPPHHEALPPSEINLSVGEFAYFTMWVVHPDSSQGWNIGGIQGPMGFRGGVRFTCCEHDANGIINTPANSNASGWGYCTDGNSVHSPAPGNIASHYAGAGIDCEHDQHVQLVVNGQVENMYDTCIPFCEQNFVVTGLIPGTYTMRIYTEGYYWNGAHSFDIYGYGEDYCYLGGPWSCDQCYGLPHCVGSNEFMNEAYDITVNVEPEPCSPFDPPPAWLDCGIEQPCCTPWGWSCTIGGQC